MKKNVPYYIDFIINLKSQTVTFDECPSKKRSREINYIGRRSFNARTTGDICFATQQGSWIAK